MSYARQLTIYRALTALYPRSFRDDYREDLAVLFSHQISDEPSVGVWARTIRDLAVTVPTHHLEAHMHRPTHPCPRRHLLGRSCHLYRTGSGARHRGTYRQHRVPHGCRRLRGGGRLDLAGPTAGP